MLSGWPSMSVARARSSSGVNSTIPASKPFAAITPETMAAPEEPRPRPWRNHVGRNQIDAGHLDAFGSKSVSHRPGNEVGFIGGNFAFTDTVNVACTPEPSRTVARKVSSIVRAMPSVSKPGPRFAVVAGTRTLTLRPRAIGALISRPPIPILQRYGLGQSELWWVESQHPKNLSGPSSGPSARAR